MQCQKLFALVRMGFQEAKQKDSSSVVILAPQGGIVFNRWSHHFKWLPVCSSYHVKRSLKYTSPDSLFRLEQNASMF